MSNTKPRGENHTSEQKVKPAVQQGAQRSTPALFLRGTFSAKGFRKPSDQHFVASLS